MIPAMLNQASEMIIIGRKLATKEGVKFDPGVNFDSQGVKLFDVLVETELYTLRVRA